jgi:hypothetical protein
METVHLSPRLELLPRKNRKLFNYSKPDLIRRFCEFKKLELG